MHRRALLAAPALLPALARAQQPWPARPIRLIAGFPPAGTTDIAARLIAERLAPRLGQPVAVENRPGATGNIAAEAVARAEPDGYTLHATNVGTGSINYTLFGPRMPVKPEDFSELGLLMQVPNVLFVHPAVPARTLAEFVALAKARPGAMNYGSAGSGGSPHMTMELFKHLAGISISHVPFRGAGPMLVEAVAGRLEAGSDNMPSCIGHIRDGRLRALATTGARRSPALPDVPTVAESGFPGFEATAWFGVQAPARTPRAIVALLGEAIDACTKEPVYRARLADLGADPPGLTPDGGTSPEAFAGFVRAEIAKWAEVVRLSGATVD
ncbi:Bug family tripartite tricarboxylate transporter substrate binding protein [Paracraurococcus lichenis]|uniref:Tripartite tricarboxylate transporter substrate binding protein n=1 Tax=Paracraurococcus lichenis TaxID=3064888 RepID=A0ABT9E0C1_9PROT|nr:tripartite tricarboxylate transporter substrate binding protein [Paracraurococcus sp. LOR1-02]MDO9709572.1 tripartite tricarboxylate transporter substrate binding protein [Paracraurococcus sp. LOR1-02]